MNTALAVINIFHGVVMLRCCSSGYESDEERGVSMSLLGDRPTNYGSNNVNVQQAVEDRQPTNPYQRVVRWWHNEDYLVKLIMKNLPRDQTKEANEKKAQAISYALRFPLFRLWPIAMTVMLSQELIVFMAYPEDRFGSTISQILLGTSQTEGANLSHFGNDDPSQAGMMSGILLAAPVVLGIFAAVGSVRLMNSESELLNNIAEKISATNLYRSYITFSKGNSNNPLAHIAFWSLSLGVSVSVAKYLSIIVNKIMSAAHFDQARAACENKHDEYTYMQMSARHECSPCGSWEFVSYTQTKSAQGCLDGLFSKIKNATEIVNYLDSLKTPRNFTLVDLEKQNWLAWSGSDFQAVVTVMKERANQTLDEIVIANKHENIKTPSTAHVAAIKDLIQHVPAKKIILKDINLGDENGASVVSGLQNNTVVEVVVMQNVQIAGQTADVFATVIPSMTNLQSVILPENHLSDIDTEKVNAAARNSSSVVEIDYSFNQNCTSDTLIDVASKLPGSKWQNIILSGIPMSHQAAAQLSDGIMRSELKKLVVNQCQITDRALAELAPGCAYLESVYLADNLFTDSGLEVLVESACNSTLIDIDLTNNRLRDGSASLLGLCIGEGKLQRIVLNQNQFTLQGIREITSKLASSGIKTFIFNDALLGDELGSMLGDACKDGANNKLETLIVRNGDLASPGVIKIFKQCNGLVYVDVGNNADIDGEIGDAVAGNVKTNTKLKAMIFDETSIDDTVLEKFAPELPGSPLELINVDHTKTGANASKLLVQQTISKVPHIDKIGASYLGRDERRAIIDAHKNTNLTHFSGRDSGQTDESALAFCRTGFVSGITSDIRNNPGITNINDHNCQTSSSSRLEPPAYLRTISGLFKRDHSVNSARLTLPNQNASDVRTSGSALAMNLLIVSGVIGLIILAYYVYKNKQDTNSICFKKLKKHHCKLFFDRHVSNAKHDGHYQQTQYGNKKQKSVFKKNYR